MPDTTTPAPRMVQLCQVAKSYGPVQALRPLDLDVSKGEFLTLLGPSGSGKTTLLGMIAGMTGPSQGQVWIDGRDVTALEPAKRGIRIRAKAERASASGRKGSGPMRAINFSRAGPSSTSHAVGPRSSSQWLAVETRRRSAPRGSGNGIGPSRNLP